MEAGVVCRICVANDRGARSERAVPAGQPGLAKGAVGREGAGPGPRRRVGRCGGARRSARESKPALRERKTSLGEVLKNKIEKSRRCPLVIWHCYFPIQCRTMHGDLNILLPGHAYAILPRNLCIQSKTRGKLVENEVSCRLKCS